MLIRVEPFGQVGGKKASLYTLKNASGAFVQITDFSGAIVRIEVPDKKGNLDNVALGFGDVKNYVKNDGYLGALIGPVGNRISNAKFTFNGKEYAFPPTKTAPPFFILAPSAFTPKSGTPYAKPMKTKPALR